MSEEDCIVLINENGSGLRPNDDVIGESNSIWIPGCIGTESRLIE